MAKVTSKLQITIPKRLAEEYRIEPGDDIEFVAAGDGIRLVAGKSPIVRELSVEERLRLFDEATARQRERELHLDSAGEPPAARDWTREELYTRGKPRR
jgi:AbrB family looped-hinge helix DNA binding protein